jgi:hypothetical protein
VMCSIQDTDVYACGDIINAFVAIFTSMCGIDNRNIWDGEKKWFCFFK